MTVKEFTVADLDVIYYCLSQELCKQRDCLENAKSDYETRMAQTCIDQLVSVSDKIGPMQERAVWNS